MKSNILADYLDLISYGFTNPMPDAEEGPWKVTAKDIIGGKINFSTARKTTLDAFENKLTNKSRPQIGDILLTKDGTLGRLAIVNEKNICVNQSVAVLRPNSNILPEYLYYLLSSPFYQKKMIGDSDGTVIKHIYITRLGKMEVNIPSIEYQRILVNHLVKLDNKIELNRQINQTLEQIAQAIFKSWFVDFEPTRAKIAAKQNGTDPERAAMAALSGKTLDELDQLSPATLKQLKETAALFSDTLVDSELGEIPEGWEVKQFSGFASNVRSSVKPNDIKEDDIYVGLEHIDKMSLSLSRWGKGSDVESNKSGFQKDDILFGKLRPYFHKVCLTSSNGICSTDILVIRPKKEFYFSLVALHTFDPIFVEYANVRSTGTRMPRASWKDMSEYLISAPDDVLINNLNETIKPLLDSLSYRVAENFSLSSLRDALLPKLLSGELNLSSNSMRGK